MIISCPKCKSPRVIKHDVSGGKGSDFYEEYVCADCGQEFKAHYVLLEVFRD